MSDILSAVFKYMPIKDIIKIIPTMVYESVEQMFDAESDDLTEDQARKLKKIITACQKGIEALELASFICTDVLEGRVRNPDDLNKLRNWSVGVPTNYKN